MPAVSDRNGELKSALGRVGFRGQFKEEFEERVALSTEEPGLGQTGGCRHCARIGRRGRSNHRAKRQFGADEFARPRHDLIGVNRICRVNPVRGLVWRMGQCWKTRAGGQWDGRGVPCLVLPNLEMLNLASTNGCDDPENLDTGRLGQH